MLKNEWRTIGILGALLIVFVKLWIVGERVRKMIDNRGSWQRRKELFRKLFGGN